MVGERAIRSRVPWDEYVSLPGVSISRLKELRRSPLHYAHRLLNPKETTALTLGRAAHCAVLEPERFDTDHAIWGRRTESGNLAPRNGKWWDAFKLEHEGRTIINADEFDRVRAIQKAVRSHAPAMRYLEAGDPEVTLQWTTWGRPCKGRVDWLTRDEDRPVLVGLKTTRDCRHFIFGSQAAKLGYHLQWAYYFDGYEVVAAQKPKVVEIVVESQAPHAVAVYVIPDDVIQQGRDEYMVLHEQLLEHEKRDTWPGPVEGEENLSLPSWIYEANDDISELGLEE